MGSRLNSGVDAAKSATLRGTDLTGKHAEPVGLTVLTHDGHAGIVLDPRIGEYVYMKAAKTNAERIAALRQRRADLGLTRLELYAHPDDHEAIKELAAKLQRKRERKSIATQPKMR